LVAAAGVGAPGEEGEEEEDGNDDDDDEEGGCRDGIAGAWGGE
jgi:hypothetical protein